MLHLDRDNVLRSDLLQQFSWLQHGFGTRLESEWPPVERLTSLRQVHSAKVLVAGPGFGVSGEGDALIAGVPGALIAVRTADCLPVLLADIRTRAVGAIHAGWRGTVAGIAIATVQAMERQFGSRREDLFAVIGPGIGVCCFEVGQEVAIQFAKLFPERDDLQGQAKLDLTESIRRQLVTQGVAAEHISAANTCTFCTSGVYHSFRRDGAAAGRMISAIGVHEKELPGG